MELVSLVLAIALVCALALVLALRPLRRRPATPAYVFRDPELARMAGAARLSGATMLQKGELADALDHPIFFLLVMSIGVVCMLAILSWGAKAANLPGISALLQHP